jgi:hypothetical protein
MRDVNGGVVDAAINIGKGIFAEFSLFLAHGGVGPVAHVFYEVFVHLRLDDDVIYVYGQVRNYF